MDITYITIDHLLHMIVLIDINLVSYNCITNVTLGCIFIFLIR